MKKIFILFIFISFFLTSCSNNEQKERIYEVKVTQANISSQEKIESYTSNIESQDSLVILSEIPGKITSITKKEGDDVKKGEIIGEIQNNEAKTILASQNQTLYELEKIKTQTKELYDSKIALYKQKLLNLQNNSDISNLYLKQSENTSEMTLEMNKKQLLALDENIKSLEKTIENNKNQEINIKNIYEKNIDSLTENAKNAQIVTDAFLKNIFESYDIFYGARSENKNRNDDFEIYISAKNTSLKNQAEQSLLDIIQKYEELKNISSSGREETKNMLENYRDFLQNDITKFLQLDALVLEMSVESPTLTKQTLDGLKAKNLALQNQTQQLLLQVDGNFILGIKGIFDSLEKIEKEYKKDIDSIQNQTEVLKIELSKYHLEKEKITLSLDLQNKNTQTDQDVKEKQTSISQNSEKELELEIQALSKEKELKINEIQTQILQSKERQNIAGVSIQNGKIISLIEGKIIKKFINTGDTLAPYQPMFEIANTARQKTIVEIHDETLKEIKKNESVSISSLTNSGSVKGIISLIFPEKNNITQNTKVEILLEQNSLFKNGEIVKIDFFPSKIEGIWIPNSSVIQKYNTYGIWGIEDERLKFKKIEKLTQVEEYTLIKGIEIGEKIVLYPSQNFLGGEKVKILQ